MSDLTRLLLEARHEAAGAKFAPFAGHRMPVSYEGIIAEHMAVRRNVGIFDVSHMGEIRIVGPKATEVINGLVTHDLRTTEVGQVRYTVMCHPHGGIVDDLLVYKVSATEVFLCVNASNVAKDFAFIQEHAGEGADLHNESEQWAQLAVQGPNAESVVQQVCELNLGVMGYYHFDFGQVAGVRCLVSRTGYTGEDGFEVYIPAGDVLAVFDALASAGSTHQMAMCGLGCRDTLRLEAKFPLYGNDLSDDTNPLEAGLDWVVKLGKPDDFVGRKAIETVKAEGVTRRLRAFKLLDKGVPRPHYGVFDGDEQVGELTSGSFAPALDAGLALGYLQLDRANAGKLDIAVRNRRISAAVSNKAFYSRS